MLHLFPTLPSTTQACINYCEEKGYTLDSRDSIDDFFTCLSDCVVNGQAGAQSGCFIEVYSFNAGYQAVVSQGSEEDIEVLSWSQPNHAFIAFWDNATRLSGKTYSGAPEGGRVTAREVDAWEEAESLRQIRRWTDMGGPPPVLLMFGPEACAKKQCLKCHTERIERLNIPYNPLTQNSNSVARGLLESCGIPAIAPGRHHRLNVFLNPGQLLPGWENDVFVEHGAGFC